MRKFIRIFVIFVLFFSCLFVGVYLAEFADTEKPASTGSLNLEKSNQENILVIVVNQLEQSTPEFLSAWSIILHYPESSGIILVPLSSSTEKNFNEISRTFRLDSQKNPNSKTEKYFKDTFNVQWDAVVVMDLHAVQLFSNWISKNENSINITNTINKPQDSNNKYKTAIELCNLISNQKFPQWELLDSSAIFDDHFHAQIPIDEFKLLWSRFSNENQSKCEVILLENGK
ncbi:MAG TPA: hypothetical protein VFC41_09690 [Anaerovoracaceae bacterium]|nr:hypothetical protein [Anaerovoracaceae bacterium]